MKVLLLDQFSEMGGAQHCLLGAAAGFLARGWSVVAGLPREGPLAGRLRCLGATVEFLPVGDYSTGRKTIRDCMRFAVGFRRLRSSIQRLADFGQFDVVYVNGPRVLPAAPIGLPMIFHLHSHLTTAYARVLTRLGVARTEAHVIGSSQSVLTSLPGLDHAKVIYNGVEEQEFRLRLDRPKVVSVIGRIAPGKGQLEFVRAARLLTDTDLRFRVHGSALFAERSYLDRVRCEAPETVQFTSWTESVRDVLHESDLLVVPSTGFESTTRVILEAFSAGTPVLAFPTGGIPEVIKHGETGLLTSDCTPSGLARSIRECHDLARLAHEARRRWETDYTLQRYQADVADVVSTVVARGASKTRTKIAANTTDAAAASKTGV